MTDDTIMHWSSDKRSPTDWRACETVWCTVQYMFLILALYLASNAQITSEQSNASLKKALKEHSPQTLYKPRACVGRIRRCI